MRRVLILGFCWVVACGPQPELCNMGGGTGGFSGGASPAPPFDERDAGFGGAGGNGFSMTKVGVTGQPVQLTLFQQQLATCGAGSKVLEIVTEVLDPMNRPVMHTRSPELAFSTTITFTPTEPGDYHVSARFEPALGTQQLDIVVARDMSNNTKTALNTGVPCRALEVMPSGLVLCQTASSLRVFRDGMQLQSIDADEFALAGDVVWTSRIGVVKRQVDTGGATPLGPGVTFDTKIGDTAIKLIGTADQVLVSSSNGRARVAFSNGVLVEARRTSGAIGQVGFFADPGLNMLLSFEGGGFAQGRVCGFNLDANGDLGCTDLGQVELMGTDATGHWSRGATTLRVDRIDKDGVIQTATMAFTVGTPFENVQFGNLHFQSTPAIATNDGFYLVPQLTPAGIVLDAYKLPEGFVPKGGSTTSLRAEHPDGRQLLFAR